MRNLKVLSAMAIKSLALTLTLGCLSMAALGWASGGNGNLPEMQRKNSENLPPATLQQVVSFDVFGLEKTSFSAERENVPAEIIEYARAAIQADTRLRYDSPGQGVLRFDCEDSGCDRIRAEVTQGLDGPVLWQTSRLYRHCPFIRFTFQPDSKKFAYKMVEQLAQDYQNAVKSSVAKIEIDEE